MMSNPQPPSLRISILRETTKYFINCCFKEPYFRNTVLYHLTTLNNTLSLWASEPFQQLVGKPVGTLFVTLTAVNLFMTQ